MPVVAEAVAAFPFLRDDERGDVASPPICFPLRVVDVLRW
jgi:hypothetical protein